MRYLKLFEDYILLESGLKFDKEIQSAIESSLSQSKFIPHIYEPEDSEYWGLSGVHASPGQRKYPVQVQVNRSKYGIVCDISLSSVHTVNSKDVNSEIKRSYNDILDTIIALQSGDSSIEGTGYPVLSKFRFFGHEIVGQKDGRELKVEDITDKVDELMNKLENEEIDAEYESIFMQFIIPEK